jgi:hypothetical protein
MKFQIPRVVTAPTVEVEPEGAAFSDTQVEIEYLDVDVKKFAGMQLFDVEVLDRTSPAFFAELQSLMADAYAKATNQYVLNELATYGTLDATTTTLPWDGDELSSFVARGAASIYENTFKFATGVIVSPTQWANLIALNDTTKRPILAAASPMNATGAVGPASLRGSLLGLDLYVDYSLGGGAASNGRDTGRLVVAGSQPRDSDGWRGYRIPGPAVAGAGDPTRANCPRAAISYAANSFPRLGHSRRACAACARSHLPRRTSFCQLSSQASSCFVATFRPLSIRQAPAIFGRA